MKSLHELWTELETWIEHFRKHAEAAPASAVAEVPPADFSPAPPPGVPIPVSHPGPPAPPVPVPLPPGGNTTDPTAPGFIMPAHIDPAPAPEDHPIDTSGPTLDFAVVGNGVPINLNGPKTIVNCPASVTVEILQQSGQPGAHNTYMATINGVVSGPYQTAAEQRFPTPGPVVSVSVDSPGLQMEIQG